MVDQHGKDGSIFVAGCRGLVGSALVRALRSANANYDNLLLPRREVLVLWGSGSLRELLHVDHLADAALVLMLNFFDSPEIINVGTGKNVTIRKLAEMMGCLTGYTGRMLFDASKPDGTPRELLDVSRIRALGWKAGIALNRGLADTYRWYLGHRGLAAQ